MLQLGFSAYWTAHTCLSITSQRALELDLGSLATHPQSLVCSAVVSRHACLRSDLALCSEGPTEVAKPLRDSPVTLPPTHCTPVHRGVAQGSVPGAQLGWFHPVELRMSASRASDWEGGGGAGEGGGEGGGGMGGEGGGEGGELHSTPSPVPGATTCKAV
jgi:hypothetical protein